MCDVLCALGPVSATGLTVFAKNSDRPPTEAQLVEWFAPRREETTHTTYLAIEAFGEETLGFVGSRPHWMWGVEHGVNVASVAIGNETIFTTLDPRAFPPALVGMDLVRLGLERAATAAGAVAVITDLLARHGQGGSGHRDADRPYWSSFLVADPAEAFVVETSGREFAVEAVASSRAISNRTTIAAFDELHRHPRQPVERLVDPRWRASQAVLAGGPLSVTDAEAHLRSHVGGADGWTVCMHVDGVEATTAALVAELGVTTAGAGNPPVARFLLGSPCRSLFVPVVVGWPLGQPPAWDRFAALTDAHRPAVRQLEEALEADLVLALDGSEGAPNTSGSCARPGAEQFNVEAWRRVDALLDLCGV